MTKYVRFEVDGRTGYGIVEGNTIKELDRSYFEPFSVTSETVELDRVRLLSPCEPTRVVCVGLGRATESSTGLPDEPCLFVKPSTTVVEPGEALACPEMWSRIVCEADLAVVIGKTMHDVEPQEAKEYIFGYTCLADVTARDSQLKDEQWTRAKSSDTFWPIGPWIVDNIDDPSALTVEPGVNDEMRQRASTHPLGFDVEQIVSLVSKVMTLNPGDVIVAGTAAAIGSIQPGDVVEVKIDRTGGLKSSVKR